MPQDPCRSQPGLLCARRSLITTVVGTLVVAGLLAYGLAGHRQQFATALGSAPLGILFGAAALQVVALVSRTESWHICVTAAGGTAGRGPLYRASGIGNLASLLNTNLAAAARIGVLRRSSPDETPRVGALVTAEVPIVTVEATLAVLASFTLVGPLGLPWFLPLIAVAVAALLVTGLSALAGRHRRGFWCGLAVLRSVEGRKRLVLFVLVAVAAQIARNFLMLHAVGVNASVFDAVAVLITMVTLSPLPLGPSVGAAAVVLILGTNGVAATAAAGVLLTATGTLGGIAFAIWALTDRFRPARAPASPPSSLGAPLPLAVAEGV